MSAAVSIQEPGSGGNQNPGTFAPSEQVPAAGPPPGPPPELPPTPDGSVAASARVMFPKVSSLSPVGESVQTAIFQPRDRETLDQSRPRLVTPPRDELKPPPLSDPNLTGPKVFTVLIGSFRVPEYAERQKQMLLDAGLPAQIRPATRADNSVWHRVTSGTFERESDARSYSRDLVTRKLAGNPVIFHVPAEQQ
jgi:cell division protein FtsN